VRHDDLPECGVARFLVLFSGQWAPLILRELMAGPRRFTELREALPGISAHTLTNRLRFFEARGLLTRTSYAEMPPRVVYELTDLAMQLRPALDAINDWGMAAPVSAFVPATTGSDDGTALSAQTVGTQRDGRRAGDQHSGQN
jgi:DNA-binding HxlR family transcriptional regulator